MGDYGDIENAFENLNLFLFSRSYLATIAYLNSQSNEGGFVGFEETLNLLRYTINDLEHIAEMQSYYVGHESEMPKPPLDPYRDNTTREENVAAEGSRSRIIFGDVIDIESSDGINMPPNGEGSNHARIVWGDSDSTNDGGRIRWGVESDGNGIVWGDQESEGMTDEPRSRIEWG